MNPTSSQLRLTGIFLACGLGLVVVAVVALMGSRLSTKTRSLQCEVLGSSVSGLSNGGKVMLRGIEVGRITNLAFDPKDPERILVGIEVDPDAPVYADATASLEIFGITGLKYLELIPGDKSKGLAKAGTILKTRLSQTSAIINSLDTVVKTSARVLDNLDRLTGSDRQKQIDSIVVDLRNTSKDISGMAFELHSMRLDSHMKAIVKHAESASYKIDSAIGALDPGRSLARVDTAAMAVSSVARRADLMLGRTQGDLYRSLEEMKSTMRNLSDFSQTIRDNPAALLRPGEKKDQ